jgi:dTDP-4-amino-4,6-dideoxygalactose transaminase
MEMFDLKQQNSKLKNEFIRKCSLIIDKSEFILGSEVKAFEEEFARFCNVKYAVGVNSGTDALFLSLKCLGIGPGDEVIVPSFTFIATSFAVTHTGARPIFVDIDQKTYTININQIEKAITKKTKAIIPVHLFGLCVNMPEILRIAKKYRISVIEDACQAHGAKINSSPAGSFGDFGCFSFYPTKNMGACGDAGIITTNSNKYYKKLLQLRDCGRSKERYLHPIIGYNSRLDNIHAALLRLKLNEIANWNKKRISNANLYSKLLRGLNGVTTPHSPENYSHVFHAYSLKTTKRKELVAEFKNTNIPYSIFYQLPLHLQKANKYLNYKKGDFPISESVSREILSLPVHPSLKKDEILKVVSIIRKVHNGKE